MVIIVKIKMKIIICILLLLVSSSSLFDIMQFGAIPDSDTVHDQFINSKAILETIKAANASKT